jgi:ABC-2 type transport system ATP-binding protein
MVRMHRDLEPADAGGASVTAAIETHRLTKRYGTVRGIEDLDLTVETGEVLGFLGPNGSGKSTTIRTLLDFQRATSGRAEILGLDCKRDSVAIRSRVGYLSGDVRLFDRMTGADHVEWFSRARGGHDERYTGEVVERLGVVTDRPVQELSKGNRQKVGLLLAFMHRPELLILDEPTSGLDPLVQAEFDGLIRETVAEGRSVLLSSHSLDEVQRVADRVAIIREGRLVVVDSVEHLRATAVRVITLRFPRPVDPAVFAALDGVEHVETTDHGLALRAGGEVAPILRRALDHGLVDLTVRPADLDELFLAYYREPETTPEVP